LNATNDIIAVLFVAH